MKLKTTVLGLTLAALASVQPASATVTVQGWWHFDSLSGGLPVDSSGNGRNYKQGGIVNAGGFAPLAGAIPSSDAAGGPLGTNGYTSSHSLRLGLEGDSDTFWDTGYVPPATNYGVEIWIKPQGDAPNAGGHWYQSDNEVWIFSSGGFNCCTGPSGGACVRVIKSFGGLPSYIQAGIIISTDSRNIASFGPQIAVDTNSWMHLALINTNGIISFWTNGVLCAVNDQGNETAPAGVMHLGTDGAWNGFNGFIDEERVFTFTNASDFNPATDLLYSASPRVITQPQTTTNWATGAATIQVDDSADPCTQYQWFLNGTGTVVSASATTPDLHLDPLALADSGKWYNCRLTNACMANGATSSNAQVTVISVNPDNVNAYRSLITGESSLLAYYPGDSDTASTLTDTKGGNNGSLQGGATFDSQTNRSFGARAVFIKHGDGYVQIPSNSSYEFAGGNGTVEAIIYLISPPTPEPGTIATIFSAAAADGSKIRYQLGASVDGGSLVYTNDAGVKLTWVVPKNLLDRQAHVAFVFSGGTSVTAYLDGQSLGTLSQSGFGASGVPCWIGYGPAMGAVVTSAPSYWFGTIDEMALYGSALTATDVAIHYSKFAYGTNTVAPSIVSQTTGPKTLYAGGSPSLQAVVAGTPPFTYQWTSNGVAIAGATLPILTLANTTPSSSATYSLNVTNLYGHTNTQPIALTFVSPPTGHPVEAAMMADHPVAYWPLNELAGTTAIDYAGGNNGTYGASGVTYGVPGPLGDPNTAVSFDGTSGRVVVPYSPALNPSGPFTVEFWAQPSALGTIPISSMVRPARTGGYEFYMSINYGGYEFHTAANGGYNMGIGDGSAPPLGRWAHVAGVWDGTKVSLYINGYSVYTSNNNFTNSNPPFIPNGSTPFYIGSRSDSVGYFSGAMSDVAFYNYALSESQLSNHMVIGQPDHLAITPFTNVIEDTSSGGVPKDGINEGATWLSSSGSRSGVMHFTATNAQSISVPAYPELAQTNLTIMFWMNSTGVVTTAAGGGGGGYDEASTLFFFRQGGTEGGLFIGLAGPSGWHPLNGIFIQGGNAGQGGVPNTIQNSQVVADGTWHHIAITIDTSAGASNSVALYVDGNYSDSANALRDWVWPGQSYTLQIGADNIGYDGGWWNNYDGMLDDIRVYSTRLSAGDITTAMGGGLLNSNLVLRYNFDTAPNGYAVTWPYGNLLTAPNVAGSYGFPGGLTNIPPYPSRSPFPVSKATMKRFGMQYFGGSR